MSVSYATKYADKIEKIFTLGSLTESGVNKKFTWLGVEAIKVFGITTVALTDYTKTGTNRYGDPTELQNVVQAMILDKDRSFSITIDRATLDDTNAAIKAGEVLKDEINEQVVPEIDTYRLNVMYTSAIANSNYGTAAITAQNAYSSLLAGTEALGNAKVPVAGRVAFCSFNFYKYIKLDNSFMLASDIAMNKRVNGQVGEVDGVKIVPVPSTYLPSGVEFILTHPSATVAAEKLYEYKTNNNVPGLSGTLIEGRVRYDAFVIDQKADALWAHLNTAPSA